MPVFSFKCECGIVEKRIIRDSNSVVQCKCGKEMEKFIGSCPDVNITEKNDPLKNKNVKVGMKEITQQRSKDHFMEHEIDNAIEKAASMVGDKEAMNMAKRFGWVDKETGKKKRKIDIK